MSEDKSRYVVSADWLQGELGAPDLKIVDASFYLPAQKRNADEEYASRPYSRRRALRSRQDRRPRDQPAAYGSLARRSLPRKSASSALVKTTASSIYDGPGIFSAPRIWWLFRIMGATNVKVLDGGLDGWKAEGRPLETTVPAPRPATFTPNFDAGRVVSLGTMRDIVSSGAVQIADARSAGRFAASEPEPREGMRSGHMPGARSLPSGVFSTNGKFKSLADLRQTIDRCGHRSRQARRYQLRLRHHRRHHHTCAGIARPHG